MSNFTEPLIVEYLDNNKWKIRREFSYYTSIPYNNVIVNETKNPYWITIKEGFVTDFASIPRVFWNIVSPYDKHAKAAVIHDYLYKTRELPRRICDEIFLEAMEVLGVSWWKRNLMYYIVRVLGKKHYGSI